MKEGEKLVLRVRCRSLDAAHPAVVGGRFSEKTNGAYHVVGNALFWNRKLPTTSTELSGALDAAAVDKENTRHHLLLNLFMMKGSGPVAVDSVSWEVVPAK